MVRPTGFEPVAFRSGGERSIRLSYGRIKRLTLAKTEEEVKLKMKKRTQNIILWTISIGLLVSMLFAFTPTMGLFSDQAATNPPVLLVNDQVVRELQFLQAQQQNRLFSLLGDDEVGRDVERILVEQLISTELLRQASASQSVSNAEVRDAVNEFRASQAVDGRGNDTAYVRLINSLGFTDETFRDFQRGQIRQQKFIDSLTADIDVSDEEVQTFFEANRQRYLSDERIVARQIVVEDEDLANELREQLLLNLADAAELAREFSVEGAEQGGALGARGDGDEPTPIIRSALPINVANAAFGLRAPGISPVVATGGLFYIVAVEQYIAPEPLPFEDVAEQAREDALEVKENGIIQRALEQLRREARISTPEASPLRYDNPVLATVGEVDIFAADVARATLLNPQYQQFISPENAVFISNFFKPAELERLIEEALAYQGSQSLEAAFIGSRGNVARSALSFVSRDASVSDEDIEAYYQENLEIYTIPANASVFTVRFAEREAAMDFREALLDGASEEQLEALVADFSGTLDDLGVVTAGQLEPELDNVLFASNAFEELSGFAERQISDILVLTEEIVEEPFDESFEDPLDELPEEPLDTLDETGEDALLDDVLEDAEDVENEDVDADELVEEDVENEDVDEDASEDADVDAELEAELDAELDEDADAVQEQDVYVLLLAIRSEEQLQPLENVRSDIESTLLEQQRAALQDTWLNELRASITVEDFSSPPSEPDVQFSTDPLDVQEPEDDVFEIDIPDPERTDDADDVEETDDADAADDEAADDEISPDDVDTEAVDTEAVDTEAVDIEDAADDEAADDDVDTEAVDDEGEAVEEDSSDDESPDDDAAEDEEDGA